MTGCAVLAVRLACVRLEGNKPGRIPPLWRERLCRLMLRRVVRASRGREGEQGLDTLAGGPPRANGQESGDGR